MTKITIDHVTKKFGDFTAVDDLDVVFDEGLTTCLLGPSGCGKTTLMRMIAGLETPTTGRILIGDTDVTALPPRHRDVAMVFQYPVMYATLTVAENIALPLRRERGLSGAGRSKRVDQMLDMLSMRDRANATIQDLSAGDRQKVAIGRSVARRSRIVLFDEPTTNVEAASKVTLVRTLKEISRELRQTIVYVTHDQTEAMTLSDKIALMNGGRIVQHNEPQTIYLRPTTKFGGWFLGNPGMNFFQADLENGQYISPVMPAPLDLTVAQDIPTIWLGIRPEQIVTRHEPHEHSLPAAVLDQTISVGGQVLSTVKVGDQQIKTKHASAIRCRVGDTVHISIPPERLLVFDGEKLIETAA